MTTVKISDKRIKNFYQEKNKKIIREGEKNQDVIIKCLLQNGEKGLLLHEIAKKTKLSRQTTNTHLKELKNKDKVYQNEKHRYLLVDSCDSQVLTFTQQMRDIQRDILDMFEPPTFKKFMESTSKLDLYQYPVFDPMNYTKNREKGARSPKDYLQKMLSEKITLKDYSNIYMRDNKYEKLLLEIANRIGAYIIYIFIQSLYPFSKYHDETINRKKITSTLINKAIDITEMFESFERILDESEFFNNQQNKNEVLKEKTYQEVSMTFKNVYPNWYIGFENYWYHPRKFFLDYESELSERNNCVHQWETKHIFKMGDYLYCNKCKLYKENNVS